MLLGGGEKSGLLNFMQRAFHSSSKDPSSRETILPDSHVLGFYQDLEKGKFPTIDGLVFLSFLSDKTKIKVRSTCEGHKSEAQDH